MACCTRRLAGLRTFQDGVQLLAACRYVDNVTSLLLDHCCCGESHGNDLPGCKRHRGSDMTPLSRSNTVVRRVQHVTFGLQLCHLGFAQALDGAQLLLCSVCEVVHGIDATLLEFLDICSRDAKLLHRQARPWSQTIVSTYRLGYKSRKSPCRPEAALLGKDQECPRPPAAPVAAPHVSPAAPCRSDNPWQLQRPDR